MNLHVDFNDIDDQGRVSALLPPRLPDPLVGSRAYLLDDEGNRCWGAVVALEDDVAFVEPDWSTWATRRQRHEVPQGYWIMAETLAGAASVAAEAAIHTSDPSVWTARNTGEAPVGKKRVAELT